MVIGVHSAKFTSEQVTANIREAVLRHEIRHPVVNDAGYAIWQAYSVRAWPTVVLIDPAGKIVDTQAGEIEANDYILVIENLIAEFEAQGQLDRSPLDLIAEATFEPLRPLNYPSRICFAPGGRLFVADTGHHRILELGLDEDGQAAEVARVFGSGQPGLNDGLADQAQFHSPRGMAFLHDTLYIADTDNHAIRAIDLSSGDVRTVAGTGQKGNRSFDGGAPDKIALRSPWALLAIDEATEDGKTVLFIAMAGSHQLWLLLDEEKLGVFAGNGREALVDGTLAEASFNQPSDLTLAMNHLLVADAEASAVRAISLGEDVRVFTLVGQGLFEFGDIDGNGAEVRLQHPTGITFYDGLEVAVPTIYIADTYNHKIKSLDPSVGTVRTLIGVGLPGRKDGSFEQAELYHPEGVSVQEGKLYILDTNNHLIRVADLQKRQVSTLSIRGLERLQAAKRAEKQPERLETVAVAPGRSSIILDLQLPAGYKLNPEAPITVRQPIDENEEIYTFTSNEPVMVSFVADGDFELPLEVTVYYCESEDERLCLISDQHLVLPVEVNKMAPAQAVLQLAVATLDEEIRK